MADLDVQPKKKTSILPWLVAAVILALLLMLLWHGCNNTGNVVNTTADTAATVATTTPAITNGDWNNIDRNAPVASYAEINNKNISVRGNDNYGIYSLGENVLFATGSSKISSDGENTLKQIATSIKQRYNGGDVRVYGYTDAVGSKDYNKELAQQRAEAVRNWLGNDGSMDSSKISINAIGEDKPVATNSNEQGRQQNRRVEVVARKA